MEPTAKASVIVFDIETYSTRNNELMEQIRSEAVEKRPAQNTLKALKTTWDTTEARAQRGAEAVGKTALDPLLASVLVVAWQADGVEGVTPVWCDADEEAAGLLQLAEDWERMAGPETVWVGHNIEGFDMPVLLGAWNRHDIEPPAWFPRFHRGRWQGRVYDTMQNTPNNRAGFVSLDALSRALGLPGAKSVDWKGEPMNGSRVAAAFEEGQFGLLQTYCLADVYAEAAVFQRLTHGGTYGVHPRENAIRDALLPIWGADHLDDITKKVASFDALQTLGVIPRGLVA